MADISLHNGRFVNRIPKSFSIAPPAAGNDFSIQCPLTEQWEIVGLLTSLNCSAAVPARTPQLEIFDGINSWARFLPGTTLAAGSNTSLQLMRGAPIGNTTSPGNNGWGVPEPLWVPSGFFLRAVTVALDVGDVWTTIKLAVIAEVFT